MTYCTLASEVVDQLQAAGVVRAMGGAPSGSAVAIVPETTIALWCRARAHQYATHGHHHRAEPFLDAAESVEAALGLTPA